LESSTTPDDDVDKEHNDPTLSKDPRGDKMEESSTNDLVAMEDPFNLDVRQMFEDLLGEDLFWCGVNDM
jgi:hypothetical protein